MRFSRYLGGTVIRPGRTFAALQDDPRRVAKGLAAMLFVGGLYTITVAMLAAGGAVITAPAVLVLSPENYYFFEMFFACPVFLLGWIMAAGFARLVSGAKPDRGSFEGLLAALGFALSVPCFVTWVTETVFAVLLLLGMSQKEFMDLTAQPGFWQIFGIAYQLVAVLWMLVLAVVAVRVSQKTGGLRAVLIGFLTTVLFMAMMLVFIR